jgi:putative transposase
MMRAKRHSHAEIAAKLAEADDLANQGKLQSDIANALGVSVMTLHRWRKAPTSHPPVSTTRDETEVFEQELGQNGRLSELQYENSRLRRLVVDLLLENMKLEDSAARGEPRASTQRSSKRALSFLAFLPAQRCLPRNARHHFDHAPVPDHTRSTRYRQRPEPSHTRSARTGTGNSTMSQEHGREACCPKNASTRWNIDFFAIEREINGLTRQERVAVRSERSKAAHRRARSLVARTAREAVIQERHCQGNQL